MTKGLRNAKGWIFDLDGTLVQTQTKFHAPAESAILKWQGIKIAPEEISERFAGVHTLEVFQQLAPAQNAETLLEEKWRYMKQLTITQPIEAVRCAPHLINQLHKMHVPMAIASASPLWWIVMCLTTIRVAPYFDHYVSADEVLNGKPAPDVFLLAAKRLGVDPTNCIAVEDGKAGVHAALSAGMKTYWLTESGAEIPGATKIKSLAEIAP